MPEEVILVSLPTQWEVYRNRRVVATINRTPEDLFEALMPGKKLGEFYSADDAEAAVYKELGIER